VGGVQTKVDEKQKGTYLGYLLTMHHIRFFENSVMDLLGRGLTKGGSHLYAGEEAVAVGSCSAIRPDDYITSTHRGHGHGIAKGGDLKELMAEICGKVTGCCKGKGGSLHLADLNTGNLGANGIVGGSTGIAAGAGLSIKLRGTDQVCVCFIGDGAVNQGVTMESFNMSATWKLPVVYVIENNLYGMSVAQSRATNLKDLATRAKGFEIPAEIVDGMDVLVVKEAVERAAAKARAGEGPTFLECKTYRYFGHSRSDPRAYRTREEEKDWKDRDPLLVFSRYLKENQIATDEEIKAVEEQAAKDIEEAVQYAIDSPYPDVEDVLEDLFV